ncbi:MAG TPA: nickel-responsive transcriptional regulator NikR [Candidatus Acetothermia bacterium]|nr:nickel-responsive transcriptional regulator NikR [Candidatus Acetothermia bacterium]
MARIVRFGVSMDEDLLTRFDALIAERGYRNRSEAIRDLIRESLARREWERGAEVVGVVVLVYNHHQRELTDRLVDLQHRHQRLVLATMHIHLDEENCLELLAVRGSGAEVQRLADQLGSLRGVKQSRLAVTVAGVP